MGAAARARVVARFALREQVDVVVPPRRPPLLAELEGEEGLGRQPARGHEGELHPVAAEGVPRVRSTAGIRVLDGARQRAVAAD